MDEEKVTEADMYEWAMQGATATTDRKKEMEAAGNIILKRAERIIKERIAIDAELPAFFERMK